MASRKKKSKGPGVAVRAAAALGGALGRPVRVVLPLLLAAGIYAAAVWCLWQYAIRDAVRPTDPRTDAGACSWLMPRDVAEINSAVHFSTRASMYDRKICSRVAAGYAANHWVEQVLSVQRRFPDKITVDLAIRRPFACVRSGGRFYVVDRGGCRLPLKPEKRLDFPVVEGVRTSRPAPGGFWAGQPLADSLLLIGVLNEVLEGRGAGMRLTSVKVSDGAGSFEDLPQLVARTASGVTIDWGSFNQSKTYLYPSAEEKRRELEKVLDKFADPAAIESIMVRYKGHSLRMRAGWPAAVGDSSSAGAN